MIHCCSKRARSLCAPPVAIWCSAPDGLRGAREGKLGRDVLLIAELIMQAAGQQCIV